MKAGRAQTAHCTGCARVDPDCPGPFSDCCDELLCNGADRLDFSVDGRLNLLRAGAVQACCPAVAREIAGPMAPADPVRYPLR